jgi:hypothetical protein
MTMTNSAIDRRNFFAAGAVAAGAPMILTPTAAGAAAMGTAGYQPGMDAADAWMDKPGTTHRMAFDCTTPKAASGGLDFANNYIHTSMSGYGTTPAQMGVILIFRHWATPYAYNDAMWAKYGGAIVKTLKLEGDLAKNADHANPLMTRPADAEKQPAGFEWWDDKYIDRMVGQGAMFAVCGLATEFFAFKLANGGDPKPIFAELSSNLVPNGHLAPSGIVAVGRVQEHGYAIATVTE